MPWHVTTFRDPAFIELSFQGILLPGELADAMAETISQGLASDCFTVLADCAALEGGHTVLDLDTLAEVLATTGIGPRLREALVLPVSRKVQGEVRFWETTCLARGLDVRGFEQRADAIAWLTGEPAAAGGARTSPRGGDAD